MPGRKPRFATWSSYVCATIEPSAPIFVATVFFSAPDAGGFASCARGRGGGGDWGGRSFGDRAAGRGVQSLAPVSRARAREVQRTRGLALSKIKKSIDPFAVRPFCWSVLAGSSFCEPPWSCERRAGHKST